MKYLLILITFFSYLLPLQSQESVFVETVDGWKIHLKFKEPRKQNSYILLLLHSQKKNISEWKKWTPVIERYGYGWLAIDFRGHGLSTFKTDGSSQTYRSFSIDGFDNDYNKMIRDIDAAVLYLTTNSYTENQIIPVGINLGANLAIKYAAINKNIPMCVLINPAMNINDVLTVNPVRLYGKRPVLFVTHTSYQRRMKETILLYSISKRLNKPENVQIIIDYKFKYANTVRYATIYKILNWIQMPYLPETIDLSNYLINESTDNFKNLLSTDTASDNLNKNDFIIINLDE